MTIRALEHVTIEEDGTERFTWKLEQFIDGVWREVPVTRTITDLRKGDPYGRKNNRV